MNQYLLIDNLVFENINIKDNYYLKELKITLSSIEILEPRLWRNKFDLIEGNVFNKIEKNVAEIFPIAINRDFSITLYFGKNNELEFNMDNLFLFSSLYNIDEEISDDISINDSFKGDYDFIYILNYNEIHTLHALKYIIDYRNYADFLEENLKILQEGKEINKGEIDLLIYRIEILDIMERYLSGEEDFEIRNSLENIDE